MTSIFDTSQSELSSSVNQIKQSLKLLDKSPMIVLTACDGAGKSTLLQRIRPYFPEISFLSIDPAFLYPLEAAPHMEWALHSHPRNVIWKFKPMVRGAFFVTTFSILAEHYILPNIGRRPIIIDSYWYRYLAKELILNPAGASVFQDLTKRLPKPDLVIELQCEFESAYRRKESISPLETIARGNPEADFVSFQREVSEKVRNLLPANIDLQSLPSLTTEATALNFLNILNDWLGGFNDQVQKVQHDAA